MTIKVTPVFTVTVNHCPSQEEWGLCNGLATVCAYLLLEGTIETLTVSAAGGPPVKQTQTWTAKILPQKVSFYFAVDNGNKVRKCRDPFGENSGASPKEFADGPGLPTKYARSGVPTGKAEDRGNDLACKASFNWVSGAILAGADAQGQATVGAPGASITVGGGGGATAGVGGPNIPLEVSFSIQCIGGRCAAPVDNTTGQVGDAASVFASGGD